MPEITRVDRLDSAWLDLRRRRPEITGCRVYGRRHGPAVPTPGDGPALQVNAPVGVGERVHPRFVAALSGIGVRPASVTVVDLLGVAAGFGSAATPRWEPPSDDPRAGRRPLVSSRQTGLILRFASGGDADAAWEHLDRWRPAYGQVILDRSLHLGPSCPPDAEPGFRPARAAVVSEHQFVDTAGRRLVYLSAEPPTSPTAGAWVAADPDRFEFHQYLRWTEPTPPRRHAPPASVVAGRGRM